MKINCAIGDPSEVKTDCLVVGIHENQKLPREMKDLDLSLNHALSRAVDGKNFEGKLKEVFSLSTLGKTGAANILLVGLGKKEELTLDRLRQCAGVSAKAARKLKAGKCCSLLANSRVKGFSADSIAQAVAEGAVLALYEFTQHKTEDKKSPPIREILFLTLPKQNSGLIAKGVDRAQKICDAVYLGRDLVSQPGNVATPTFLANEAKKLAKSGLKCKILDLKDMKKLGMGALIGVAKGSAEPPKFIILEHLGGKKKDAPVVLVGKGLTFDSGGISIKPSSGMEEMKTDMSGGAAVIATMKAVSDLKLRSNVIGLVPATENMPDGRANKPGDVLKTMSGKTIEIINTDAEGRLILADALCYAEKLKPAAVIDIATLTGACVVALGNQASGLMGTDQKLVKALISAGEIAGERAWQLPLFDEYDEQIKSDIADMKNSGNRWGGAITAAAMLKKFTSAYNWVHVDIAGTAWTDKEKPYVPKGAVGVGVRLFLQFLTSRGSKK